MKKDKIIKEISVVIFPALTNMIKTELIDAIAASAKLSKADAGRVALKIIDDELMQFVLVMKKVELTDAISAGAKLTKADAGRVLNATIHSIHKKLKVVFGGKGQ